MTYKGNAIDLVEIETDSFFLTIKGKPVHPDIEQLYIDKASDGIKALLEVNTYNTELLTFLHYHPEDGLVDAESSSVFSYPFFYEQQDYQILIESKGDLELEFYHQNRNIRESVSKLSRKNNILMGTINFRNDVGYSEIEIRSKGKILMLLKIEVFPSKIDYRNDYFKLLNEVNREVYNLSYDFFRSTFQGMKLKEAEKPSQVEFFTIFQKIFKKFLKAYRRIEKYPHHRLNKLAKVLPSSRVKKINRQSVKWMRRNTQYYDQELGLPVKMLNIDKQSSFDTFENRFVKWIISELLKKLANFEKSYRQMNKDYLEEDILKTLDSMSKKLDYILKNSFLKEIGDIYKIDSLSLVLQMAPGYREVYKYYLMLLKGLSINGQIFRLSMKQIWELYEYWCFLELNRLLRNKYNLVKHNLIDINYSGIYVSLNKSSSSYVEYENPATGEIFKLSYNTSEGEGVTTGQKPDNVLTLKKEGSDTEYKFIFDAKYRINPAVPGSRYHGKYNGIPGPEEDTINTMHRYRDAIVYSNESIYEHRMVGAYVLFPYTDEEKYREHDFYKSIDKVNVGAFPLLPGSTELVADFLENLIEESYLGNYERNVLPAGSKDYSRDTKFEQNVLVGSIRKKGQLQFLLDKKIYYIPCKRVKLEENHLEYIAIYLSKKDFPDNYGVSYYGKIKGIQARKRKDINVPMTKNNGEELYYVFSIESWSQLVENILPEGYGVRGSHIYSNFMLLQKARTIPELSIKTIEQWRVWLELKRVQGEVKILLDKKKLDQHTLSGGFQINDIEVKVNNGGIVVEQKDVESKEFLQDDLAYNLRGVMKEIF
ncbi:DUF2357 domain-containing protein [Natronospora cellulosivora (SeqCode)]